ncbi:MAG: hypothetical protein ACI89L_001916 [Phycisphaerales bacterium]|jgi:hypothetical protein
MDEAMTWVGQFGVAGLIAWMWLAERRASAVREKQLTEVHGRLMLERQETEVLLKALNDNTRALASLESCQRGVLGALGRVVERGAAERGPSERGPVERGMAQRGVGRSA